MKITKRQDTFLAPEIAFYIISHVFISSIFFLMKNILLCLLCASILASCTIGSDKKTSNETNTGATEPQYKADLQTASSKIKDTPEFAECMAPSVKMCISSVGMQLAQKAKSTDFCSELNTPEEQDGCRFSVVISMASEKNDATICNTLSGNYIGQCTDAIYRTQAVTAKDISLCDKLGANGSGTGENMMMSGKKDECIMSVLMASPETKSEDCEKIHEKSFQDMCKSSIQSHEEVSIRK